ncbi:hypothetical protein Tco_0079196 [Tanacetum coccineum]
MPPFKDKVMLVLAIKIMLLVLGEIMKEGRQGLLNVIIVKVKDTWLAQKSDQILDETRDLDAYDSDCDDISNAKAVLMANLSNYGSDVILEEKAIQKKNNESLTAELERYKERVKTFKQCLNIDLSTRENMIDSQIDDMIKEKLALKKQIDSLEQNLSNQIKEKESLLQTFTVFKNESKGKESKYMDKEIDLEKKIKELDNIVYKVEDKVSPQNGLCKYSDDKVMGMAAEEASQGRCPALALASCEVKTNRNAAKFVAYGVMFFLSRVHILRIFMACRPRSLDFDAATRLQKAHGHLQRQRSAGPLTAYDAIEHVGSSSVKPEGQLTLKSDVYCFGVVLLKAITGRKTIDHAKTGCEHNLVAWIEWRCGGRYASAMFYERGVMSHETLFLITHVAAVQTGDLDEAMEIGAGTCCTSSNPMSRANFDKYEYPDGRQVFHKSQLIKLQVSSSEMAMTDVLREENKCINPTQTKDNLF